LQDSRLSAIAHAQARCGEFFRTVAAFAPDASRRTLQVAIVHTVFDTQGISWSFMMAFAVVTSVPVILVFLAAQKWFVSGLTAGSLKG
jgi:multiple sugar transport system permease protein